MKSGKVLKMTALVMIVLLSLCMLFSCGEKTIYIAKDGITEYNVVYSDSDDYDHSDCAEDIFSELYFLVEQEPLMYTYTEKPATGKEILIGGTDRPLSLELKSAVDAKGAGVWWAYGYKDGNLGYYANSEEAMNFSWENFMSEVCKDESIELRADLWVVDGMTEAQYEAYLKDLQDKEDAEKEKERQEKIDVIKAKIVGMNSSLMGTMNTSGYYKPGSTILMYGTPTIGADKLYDHPRIWTNATELADIKANLKVAENELMYGRVLAKADLSYTGVLSSELNSTGNKNFTVMQDPAKIEALAFVYLITGDELYGYTAIMATKNFLKTVKFRPNQGSWNGDQIYDIGNDCGTALSVFAEVYDWCYDLLTQDDKDYIVKGCVNKLASKLELTNPPDTSGCVTGHSTASDILRDWLTFAIAVADEYEYIYNHVMSLMEKYYAPAPNWYYPSGGNFQGSAYGINKTYLHILAEIAVLKATGEKLYDDDVSFKNTVYTYISYLRPDGESLRVGDDYNGGGATYRVDPRMAFYGSMYYNDPMMKAWAMKLTDNFRTIGYTGEYLTRLLEMTPVKVLLLNDPNVEYDINTVNTMPLVNFTGAPSSSLIARSAWGDPGEWMTFVNVNEAYGGNHDHKDTGTFQIYYKGILAPDTGVYQYRGQTYGEYYDSAYVKSVISKNGLLIYNPSYENKLGYVGGQEDSKWNENATLDKWFENGDTSSQTALLGKASALDENGELLYAYIASDITKAYSKSTVELVTRSTISIATGNEDHPLLFIVYDRIKSDNANYKKTYLLHTMEKPTFVGGTEKAGAGSDKYTYVTGSNVFYYTNTKGPAGDYAEDNPNDKYNGKLTSTTLLPENATYSYIGGEGKRFWVIDGNAGSEASSADYPVAEIGWGRVEISTVGNAETDSFLNVMYVGDADATGAADAYVPTELVKGTTHEGAVTFGSCVMFAKSEKAVSHTYETTGNALISAVQSTLVSDTVSFDTTGKTSESELDYYVTGLKAGNWELKVNGTTVKTLTVKAEETIATFSAAVGEITLTYKGA